MQNETANLLVHEKLMMLVLFCSKKHSFRMEQLIVDDEQDKKEKYNVHLMEIEQRLIFMMLYQNVLIYVFPKNHTPHYKCVTLFSTSPSHSFFCYKA